MTAIELDVQRGVKRAYFKSIENYSSEELNKIFVGHISQKASVTTDKWTGYIPLQKNYNITQIKSNNSDFFELNTIIHQLKAGLRSVYSWVHKFHIEKYLDEYSYRLNRSIHKQTIFDNLINRIVKHKHVGYKDIIIST